MLPARAASVRRSLAAAIGLRLAAVFGLIIAVQVGACLYENLGDHAFFARNYVDIEVRTVGALLHRGPGGALVLDEARIPAYYAESAAPRYAFRIIDPFGRRIGERNGQILSNLMPPPARISAAPFNWFRIAEGGEEFHIAGGAPWPSGGQVVWVEVATLGDPEWRRLWVLLVELAKDVWIPILPIVLVAFPVAILTVRQSLKPLQVAADQAQAIDARAGSFQIDDRNVPYETACFVAAINRLLGTYQDLLVTQQRLILHASHELRTPLALMLLELGRMPGEGARRLERDVAGMADLVNRTLQLGRIEAMRTPCREEVDLVQAADDAVHSLRPLIGQRGCEVEIAVRGEERFMGDLTSIREATRNLIENAIKHTPAGTRILITCGPGFLLRVEDSGGGVPLSPPDALFEPFRKGSASGDGVGLGLAIVKKTVELHKGRINAGRSTLGGACFEIEFPCAAKAGA
ncbi:MULTISPECIES: HAMP domain-containing sensor histidine kinase [Rhodomicrobium]|uniref:sensor histidine kinase n=1 Tax=Rhodomicrobium TaxID=1068 RepID=UPI000B4A9961|nr:MULTISPECIES: HAMP domain-containing sensor histidine kinase [Rhodomicrobium]